MATRTVDHLLVGGGLAAASCARTLREEGAGGSIVVVGREPDPPYDRPPLSKGYLRGEGSREEALVLGESWWEANDVELLTRTSAMKLDVDARTVKLSTKDELSFATALVATGANVRRLRAEGSDLEGIHYLRAFGNADAIRSDLAEAERVVLIGGSYIGCEVAASVVAGFGVQCTILMQEEVTLERGFGREIGGFFQGVLTEHGVQVVGGDELERFEGSGERVQRVVTKGGVVLDCDCVVIGAGVTPDVMLARSAGLELGESGGILCSPGLESSAPGVYAAGDVCEWQSAQLGGSVRVEHWDVALEQGRTAARNMLGQSVSHEAVPYFFSDLADWVSMEAVGRGAGEPVIRGSLDDGDFTAFYTAGDRVTAALSVGRPGDLQHARRWIAEGGAPNAATLADEDAELDGA